MEMCSRWSDRSRSAESGLSGLLSSVATTEVDTALESGLCQKQ